MDDTRNNTQEGDEGIWILLPDNIILHILSYLDARDVLTCSEVCKVWKRVTQDEFLWKDLVASLCSEPLRLNSSTETVSSIQNSRDRTERRERVRDVGLPPWQSTWKEEYKRLYYHTPIMQSETLEHEDEVWHVSFSNKGDKFASCCKSGYIKVWSCETCPSTILFSTHMGLDPSNWNDSFMSQFSYDDKLVMVTGDKRGSYYKGDVAIFDITDGYKLLHILPNSPYDVFGTWFSPRHVLVGTLHILGYPRGSISELKVMQLPEKAGEKAIIKKRFTFRNIRNFVRCVLIANCVDDAEKMGFASDQADYHERSHLSEKESPQLPSGWVECPSVEEIGYTDSIEETVIEDEFADNHVALPDTESCDDSPVRETNIIVGIDREAGGATCSYIEKSDTYEASAVCESTIEKDKMLIFTWGHKHNDLPHEIAFKRIHKDLFDEIDGDDDDDGDTMEDAQNRPETSVDHIIDMQGHIVGLHLSPDHRYLYANCRPICEDGFVEDEYPELSNDVLIHVIDMRTMEKIKVLNTGHQGFTQESVFYLYLDINTRHILSGSEDKRGYLWDRHYELQLATFTHSAPVCCTALNPRDPETLATASDDCTLKLWRSRHRKKLVEGPRYKLHMAKCQAVKDRDSEESSTGESTME